MTSDKAQKGWRRVVFVFLRNCHLESSAEVSGVLEQSCSTMVFVMVMVRIIVLVLACCHGKYHGTRTGLESIFKRCHSICYCIAKDGTL